MKHWYALCFVLILCPALPGLDAVHAATIRVAPIYLSPDASSQKLVDLDRGREVIFLGTSGNWAHVEANVTEERIVTGWMENKGLIQPSTQNGDQILFGEAVDSEDEASRPHGRRYAAQDAMRLYAEVQELFPKSDRGRGHVSFC
jgi:hypothetical protein